MGVHIETARVGDVEIELETGRIARQAHGAVVVRAGRALLLGTVVGAEHDPEAPFFPLTVDYREKMAAAARIPGNFFRRETRQSGREILISRLVDRTLRPLFAKGFRGRTQVAVTVYSAEESADLEGLALVAAAAAVHLSDLPFHGPVAGCRLVCRDAGFVSFPAPALADGADLDLVLSGNRAGLVMAEGSARQVPEALLLDALDAAAQHRAPLLDAMDRLREVAGRPRRAAPAPEPDPVVNAERALMLAGERADGRGPSDVRAISAETGLLAGSHGSALFTRGDTQALVTTTLGGNREAQDVESLWGNQRERFLLHYNFPSFAVGEARPDRGPGRREIGHGHLARRALKAVLPSKAVWPYTTRVVSDITESDGSSSMATVCGGCLAMLDAGVPLEAPVAGIAMGLVSDGERHVILTDIRGAEDHIGDMDFKLAGTADGITAFQLDNKLGAISREVLTAALDQAAVARREVLAAMQPAVDALAARTGHARLRARVRIPQSRIGQLIGPGGRNLQSIQQRTGARIDVSDDGTVLILGSDEASTRDAVKAVESVALELKKGSVYLGEVVSVKAFGVFVRIADHEALVHTSEGGEGHEVGAELLVRVLGADSKGRLKLSAKAAANASRDEAVNT